MNSFKNHGPCLKLNPSNGQSVIINISKRAIFMIVSLVSVVSAHAYCRCFSHHTQAWRLIVS